MDGKIRYEIPDDQAKVIAGAPQDGTLPQLLDHPELYKAYPDLANTTYGFADAGSSGIYGSYSKAKDRITLSAGQPETMETLLHELQHAVQAREGFAGGSNAEMLAGGNDAYRRTAGEVEARNVEARMRMDPTLRGVIPPWATESVRPAQQIVAPPTILDAFFGSRSAP